MTNYVHRLGILIPVSLVAGVASWWADEVTAGRLEFDDPTQWIGLNATGLQADGVTYRGSCGSYTNSEIKRILIRVGQLAGISLPADWDTKTLGQKIDWVMSQRDSVFAATNIWLAPCDNLGDWAIIQNFLNDIGLKAVGVN